MKANYTISVNSGIAWTVTANSVGHAAHLAFRKMIGLGWMKQRPNTDHSTGGWVGVTIEYRGPVAFGPKPQPSPSPSDLGPCELCDGVATKQYRDVLRYPRAARGRVRAGYQAVGSKHITCATHREPFHIHLGEVSCARKQAA